MWTTCHTLVIFCHILCEPCGSKANRIYPQVTGTTLHTRCGKVLAALRTYARRGAAPPGLLVGSRPRATLLLPSYRRRIAVSDPIMNSPASRDFTLDPADTERLANLAGPFDAHLRQIELKLGVEIANRGNIFRVTGPEPAVDAAQHLLTALYDEAASTTFDNHAIHLRLNDANVEQVAQRAYEPQDVAIKVKRGTVRGRGANQAKYLHAITTHDINFGIGPAGTGKTFLAVASAVEGTERVARAAADPGAPGGGGWREAGLSARRSQPEGRPLSASAVRRAV